MLYVDEVIGRGSFGTVYRGRMRSPDGLTRRVAVKVLSDDMSADSRAVARFRDEARLLALIDHPGLVPVYALEKMDDKWAVVMGYVDGFDLVRAVRQGPLPPETVRQIGIQVADILDALWSHEHPETGEPLEVVHRDVKPHNMMIDNRGRVRLLDLGVASAHFEARESATVAGEVAGTLAYMSPQRWARRDDKHKGDIYALGATLYQLATGRLAQEAGPHPEAHAERMESGAEVVPKPLFDLIQQAMAFDDSARPDAHELAAALRAIGPLSGLGPREWAQHAREHLDLMSSGLPTTEKNSSFLGGHNLGSETLLTTQFYPDEATVTSLHPGPTDSTLLRPPPEPSRRGWIAGAAGALGLMLAIGGGMWWAAQPHGTPVVVALAPTDPDTVVRDARVLAGWLEGEIGHPMTFIVADSYEHTGELLVSGQVDFAQMPHRTGLLTMERDPRVVPLATKVIDGTSTVDPYMLVRHDDPGTELSDFLGSTICYSDKMSNTGYAIPRAWISAQGYDPDTDFVTRISGNHAEVLRDLIAGTCRMGGTFNRNLLTADGRGIPSSRLKIFALTGDSIPHDGWYSGPATDPEVAAKLKAALLEFEPKKHLGAELAGEYERVSGFRQPPHAHK